MYLEIDATQAAAKEEGEACDDAAEHDDVGGVRVLLVEPWRSGSHTSVKPFRKMAVKDPRVVAWPPPAHLKFEGVLCSHLYHI